MTTGRGSVNAGSRGARAGDLRETGKDWRDCNQGKAASCRRGYTGAD